MSLTDKQVIGNKGEEIAASWLKDRGHQMVDRNYRKKWGEIDIVCKKGDRLHFIEVKTVTRDFVKNLSYLKPEQGNQDDYEPEDNIHPWKLKRLSRAIQTYLLEKKINDEIDWQLDAVSVYLDRGGNLIKIELLEDVF
ncbi:MAG: YraN family protein [bacterium]